MYFNRSVTFVFVFPPCDPCKKKKKRKKEKKRKGKGGGGKNSTVSSSLLCPPLRARSFITPFLFHRFFLLSPLPFSFVFITLFAPFHPFRRVFFPSREISRSRILDVLLKPLLLSRERSSGINGEFSFLFLFFFFFFLGRECCDAARNFAGNKLFENFRIGDIFRHTKKNGYILDISYYEIYISSRY